MRALTYGTDTMHSRAAEALHVLIPPGESRGFEHDFDHLTVVEGGTLGFEFQYGATGTRVHKLEFPLSLTRQNDVIVKSAACQRNGERGAVLMSKDVMFQVVTFGAVTFGAVTPNVKVAVTSTPEAA